MLTSRGCYEVGIYQWSKTDKAPVFHAPSAQRKRNIMNFFKSSQTRELHCTDYCEGSSVVGEALRWLASDRINREGFCEEIPNELRHKGMGNKPPFEKLERSS